MTFDNSDKYVLARKTLLDAVEALGPHKDSIILVGAHAVYAHVGEADFEDIRNFAPYTTDADFTIAPTALADTPDLTQLLTRWGFTLGSDPGSWRSPDNIVVDLTVPESLAGEGRRGAALGAHGRDVARRAKGLEASLVDQDQMVIPSLDPSDTRSATIRVAGPGALVVAKAHKIAERIDEPNRLRDKDSIDILRLLRTVPFDDLVPRLQKLRVDDLAGPTTQEALVHMSELYASVNAPGAISAARAFPDSEVAVASLVALAQELLSQL